MRSDMAKILVDWRRPPSRIPRGRDGRRFRDSSDAPFLPMKAGYRNLKSLNENMRPLARYLKAQVNRPWNSVYREICAVIDGRNAVQRHILKHLRHYVAVHVRLVGGELIDLNSYLGLGRLWQPLYVRPRTGLLRRNPSDESWCRQYRERQRMAELERAATRRGVSPTRQLHRLDGQWFAVHIAELPSAPAFAWDAVRRCHVVLKLGTKPSANDERDREQLDGRRGVYAVWKRQLGARELRSYGLRD